ncbi:MAG: tRNA (N(6)-L-threonylcarbamoyladenosine(37)-C(2))-methylthiotransferase MtaB [Treponema sp.]|jgi:threonylcarbamoyladenosine tRNA methylthiotransferase MtaB|nr:tRNA (N(6)-L-threonylcarbamoyladenosine(37)-C(2))-methylthiotransferase MtaB [Treponema sp.]
MPSVLIQTLGCKLNRLESEAVAAAFKQAGFVLHESTACCAQVVVINTCTVTSRADQKARRVIRKALRDYPDSIVVVTGCYAQLNHAEIEKLDDGRNGRLLVLRGAEKESILDLPRYINEGSRLSCALEARREKGEDANRNSVFQFNPERFSSRTRSLLKIQDGCDNNCTYCRIRLARGTSVSLDAREALKRLQILEKNHLEAVITGVNISGYRSREIGLGGLLDYLLSGTERINLRLSSLAPERVDENLCKILSGKRIRPHFHLSIQSGSEKILERMGRSYNAATVERAAALLRGAKDDPFLACDIITGFPGETADDFEQTLKLCRKIGFAWIHVFPYSKRPGTPAFSFSENVAEREILKRSRALSLLARQGRTDYILRWLGREVEALVENSKSRRTCRAVSENYLKLLVSYKGRNAPPPGASLRCFLPSEQAIDPSGKDYDALAAAAESGASQ